MSDAKRVLVFQHVDVEHPGIFRQFLAADGHTYHTVELDAGEAIPSLAGFDALWVMGGPMDVWEEAEHPWLVAEKAAIRDAVLTRGMPYLGFCLGHQLLGDALGGEVGRAEESEVGILPVNCNASGLASPYLQGLPASLEVLQWHGAEVSAAPPGAAVLASSARCANQAMSVGPRAFSMQFHVEITATTITDWNGIPAYASALERILGQHGAQTLMTQAQQRMPLFNTYARQLYQNWKLVTGFG
jgi:GMP synthase-like glutamine amidotransferase